MAVKSDFGIGETPRQAANHLCDFFRVGAAVGVADHQPAHILAEALLRHAVEVVEAAPAEIRVARSAVFAAAATGVHGVLQIDDHFQAVVVQAGDGFAGHEEVFFRRSLQRHQDIEQPGFDDDDGHGNPPFVPHHELYVGPLLDFGTAAAGSAEQGQFHGPGIDRVQSGRQILHEPVGAGKADLGIADAKDGKTLQQADGIGHGDVDIRLLQAVAEAGIEKLDLSGFAFRHVFPLQTSECNLSTGLPREEVPHLPSYLDQGLRWRGQARPAFVRCAAPRRDKAAMKPRPGRDASQGGGGPRCYS